jgi:hypothetical protein
METDMTQDATTGTDRARLLHIYLNDHLAGSAAGSELARRCRDHNRGTPLAEFLDDLIRQIEEDQLALEAIMDALGAPKNPAKLAAAWLAEKVGRLKLNGQLLQYSDLSRLLELEGLGLGIHGKADLWRTLTLVRDAYPPLADAPLEALERRAADQLASVEEQRASAAELAFKPTRVPA